ncbi:MAG: ATP-binding cassette domain-containing protein [Sandaracinaceae bacterium]|nr:ATP-binding cassette domain-containing protein [Sandaracinaceae bacterium]
MIEVTDVHVAFGDKKVLTGVSLQVPEGGIYALIGPGAAGKSVLLKVIAGLITPTRGSVQISGDEITTMDDAALMEMRRHVGMLFQNYALFDYMSVGDNIAFPLRRLFDLPEAEIATRVAERLERMALPGFEERAVGGLSGGQKKRVGVARATVSRPKLLLYDEPTAGLDPVTSQKIYDLIKEEQRQAGTTNVVISSDVAGLLTIADRVGMLHRGEMIFTGTVDEARSSEIPEVRQFVHGLVDGPL